MMGRTNQFRPIMGALLLAGTMGFAGCNTGQRLGLAERVSRTNIRQPFRSEMKDTVKRDKVLPKYITYKDDKGVEQSIVSAELDSVTGEHIISQQLAEVTVTAASKSVAERNGKVNIDFIVTVPGQIMQDDWKLVVRPVLDNDGEHIRLDSLEIAGFESYYFNKRRDRQRARDARNRQRVNSRISGRLTWADLMRRDRQKDTYVPSVTDVYNHYLDSVNRSEGTKVDTVMNKRGDFVFYYPHQIKTDNMATHLRVWFDSYIINQGDTRFRLAASDTIHFYISSFLQFLDNTPRYVRKTIQRRVTDRMTANIQFRVGQDVLVDTLGDNRGEMQRISAKLEEIYKGNEFIVDSVVIAAYASPEGGIHANRALAERRGKAISGFLGGIDRFNVLPDNMVSRSQGEDWTRLRKLIHDDPNVLNAESILRIIDTEADLDKREHLIRSSHPADYAYIREHLYPQLRAVDFVFHLARRNMVEDVMVTDVIDEAYAEAIALMKKRKYKEAMPKILEYRDWNTAVCYMSLGYNNTALQILSEQPESSDQLYLMAILHARENRTEQAVRCYMKSCEMDDSKIMRGELDPEIAELIKTYGLNQGYY